MNMNRVPCPRQAVYTCVATSGAHTEEAHTRVLPTEPEGDGVGQWEEVEEPNLEEEGVCKEEVLTWASSLLVPEGELALLPCQAGEEVTWDRQGQPIEVLVLQPIEVLECPCNASCALNHLQLRLFPCIHNLLDYLYSLPGDTFGQPCHPKRPVLAPHGPLHLHSRQVKKIQSI